MKKRTQRLLSLLLVVAMSASVIGCGQTGKQEASKSQETTPGTSEVKESSSAAESSTVVEEESPVNEGFYPIVDEKVTITVGGPDNSTPDWNATDFVKLVEEEMNVKMACATVVGGSWQERFKLMLADETLPDLVFSANHYITDINLLAEEGFFLALDEYLEYAPNLKAFLEAHPDYEAAVTAPDGHIYGLVQYTESPYGDLSHAYIRTDWLERVGMEVPNTVDELYDVLKAFKEKDADGDGDPNNEIPMSDHNSFTMIWATLMTAFGMPSVRANTDLNYGLMFDADGNLVVSQTTENYKEFLTFMNKLYNEGLYDNEGFKNAVTVQREKTKAGNVGVFSDWSPVQATGLTKDVCNPNFSSINGLSSELNPDGYMATISPVGNVCHVLANADTDHPEVVVKLIDFLFTEEGKLIGAYGTEKSRTVTPLKEDSSYIDYDSKVPEGQEANYANKTEYLNKKARPNAAINIIKAAQGRVYYLQTLTSPDQITDDMRINYGTNAFWAERAMTRELVPIISNIIYTAEETEERSILVTDVQNYLVMTRAQFITGELSVEKDWDNYIKTLEQMGINDLLEIETVAYERTFGK